MGRFAIVRRQAPRDRDDLSRLRGGLGLGGQSEDVRLEDVGHDQAWRRGEARSAAAKGSPRYKLKSLKAWSKCGVASTVAPDIRLP